MNIVFRLLGIIRSVVMRILWATVALVQLIAAAAIVVLLWNERGEFTDTELVLASLVFSAIAVLVFLFVFAIDRVLKKED